MGGAVWVSWPVASDCEVQQDVERSVKWPVTSGLTLGNGLVEVTVSVEINLVWLPVDSECVEVAAESTCYLVSSSLVKAWSMESSMVVL